MGIYLNPGSLPFQMAVNSQIYVDKTSVIAELNHIINTEQRFVCVSRPRRFGKSMTANMLSAYYDRTVDTNALFAGFSISADPSFEKFRNRFDVIHINMLDFITREGNVNEQLEKMQLFLIKELKEQYPGLKPYDETNLSLTMAETFQLSQKQFVVILDEWDCLFRMRSRNSKKAREQAQQEYLDFLREWLKDRNYIALAYLTGILPIRKYGEHSALNMFFEYSMISPFQFAPFTGFTDEEVLTLCKQYGSSYKEIKEWYDGYKVKGRTNRDESAKGKNIYQIYCPLSVVNAILTGSIQNYWNQTESYLALKENINRNYEGLHEIVALLMEGARQKINIDTYQNDMETFHDADDVLTMLVHLGYLGYDPEMAEVYIPNRELLSVFQSSVRNDRKWDVLFEIMNNSQELLEATWDGNSDLVARMLEEAHEKAGNLTYNDESALSYAIRLAYFNAEQYYTLVPEMQAGKGYADLIYIPSPEYPEKPAMLIELKYDQDAETAIRQIHRQNYPETLRHYKGNLLLVAIAYDKNISSTSSGYNHHSCIIEKA